MAHLTILYWRDIPAQIVVKAGRVTAKRPLHPRFQQAIDRAAMADGARDEDAYLAQWRRGEPTLCGDDAEAEAEAAARRTEQAYDQQRLARLVAGGGRDTD